MSFVKDAGLDAKYSNPERKFFLIPNKISFVIPNSQTVRNPAPLHLQPTLCNFNNQLIQIIDINLPRQYH